jgi:hypothetical protein
LRKANRLKKKNWWSITSTSKEEWTIARKCGRCQRGQTHLFKMGMFRAAHLSAIRHIETQQNQNQLTLMTIYIIATTQRRKMAKTKKIKAIIKNKINAMEKVEESEEEVTTFQRRGQNSNPNKG